MPDNAENCVLSQAASTGRRRWHWGSSGCICLLRELRRITWRRMYVFVPTHVPTSDALYALTRGATAPSQHALSLLNTWLIAYTDRISYRRGVGCRRARDRRRLTDESIPNVSDARGRKSRSQLGQLFATTDALRTFRDRVWCGWQRWSLCSGEAKRCERMTKASLGGI